MTINKKLSVLFLALTVTPILLIGFLLFNNAKQNMEKEIFSKLEAVANAKADKIDMFFAERQKDLRILQNRFTVKTHLPILDQFTRNRNDPAYLKAQKALNDQMKFFEASYYYANITLANTQGKVIYVSNPAYARTDIGKHLTGPDEKAFEKAKADTYLSEIFKSEDKLHPYIMLLAGAVRNNQDKLIGVAAFRIDMNIIYRLIQDNISLGQSGETLLVKKTEGNKVLFLSPLRYQSNAVLVKTVAIGEKTALPAQWAADGETGHDLATDYRGKKVLAAWQYIPSLNWGLVVKVDASEAFAPIYRLMNFSLAVLGITLLLAIAVTLIVARSITAPIRSLHRGVEIIGRGNLDYRVGTTARDEIGQLSRAFDRMTENLKKIIAVHDQLHREIAVHKEKEEKLELATTLKSEFASMVSHELRTPLSSIIEGVKIILDGLVGKINAQQKEILDTIKINGERLKRVINSILDYQKLEAGVITYDFKENDINEAINEVYKTMILVTRQKGLDFILELEREMPKLKFDRDKIIQVMTNLVNNAVKLTEKGTIKIKTVSENNYAHVMVTDTGPGIRKEDMPKLFQTFQRLESPHNPNIEGTGLGLAICKEIILRHNGKIWAESELGKGTTFHFALRQTAHGT